MWKKLFYIEINNPPNSFKFEFQHMIIGVVQGPFMT